MIELIKGFITGCVILVGAFFVTLAIAIDLKEQHDLQQENIELRIKNARLEEKLKALDDEKAEQTKKKAELNGIGG